MSHNRFNNNSYNSNLRYNNRVRLINSYINNVDRATTELSYIIDYFRNTERNMSRLIFNNYNEYYDINIEEDEEINNEEENAIQRSTSRFLFTTPRNNLFNYRNNYNPNLSSNLSNNLNNGLNNGLNNSFNNGLDNGLNNSLDNGLNNNTNSDPIEINRNSESQTNTNDFLNNDIDVLMTPIIIRPSLDQINTATVTSSFDMIDNPINNCCPISLVEFRQDDIVSKIIYCGHIFLKIELDNWFRSNTRCPICRYDIRDYRSRSEDII
tara:strand:+ start:1699 stop:2499 length:801 start_codon:yes stop_codon:yes gene_type:complete